MLCIKYKIDTYIISEAYSCHLLVFSPFTIHGYRVNERHIVRPVSDDSMPQHLQLDADVAILNSILRKNSEAGLSAGGVCATKTTAASITGPCHISDTDDTTICNALTLIGWDVGIRQSCTTCCKANEFFRYWNYWTWFHLIYLQTTTTKTTTWYVHGRL